MRKKGMIACVIMVSLSLVYITEARKPKPGMSPPQAALDACQNASEGDVCTMTGKEGDSLNGACETVPSGEFACVPDDHKRRGGEGRAARGDDGEGRRPHRGGGEEGPEDNNEPED